MPDLPGSNVSGLTLPGCPETYLQKLKLYPVPGNVLSCARKSIFDHGLMRVILGEGKGSSDRADAQSRPIRPGNVNDKIRVHY
jgi:hypothetical protein